MPDVSFRQSRSAAHTYSPVYCLAFVYLVLSALLRIVLWTQFGRSGDVSLGSLLWVLPAGAINDLIEAAYLLVPLALYLLLTPPRWQRSTAGRTLMLIGCALTIGGLIFQCVIEYFFFEEFDSRFNLVAVDYLVYPTEVIGDINDAYPVKEVLAISIVSSVAIVWALRRKLLAPGETDATLKGRLPGALAHFAVVLVAALFITTGWLGFSSNRVTNELVSNGPSSFFRAARTSEIDYQTFYVAHDPKKNFAIITDYLKTQGGELSQLADGKLTRHFAAKPEGLGKLNVIVVSEESLGAEFSKLYGSPHDYTPNLDATAQQGIWFRHAYASGTRTVRGLEAISASFPPIPSVSILRRPNNEGIATWGGVMQTQGYNTSFIYGGYGYFDNMNYYFGHNGFDVVDRQSIDKVRFANIWGVSDEDLFDRALQYYDEKHTSGQPFFSIIMTTSNHKPFTFREGVPGIKAKGGGRSAGVRYADFALGYFLKEAEKHPWFKDTVFVVVADHGARVYGKADIPLRTYEIPMLFYSPAHLPPQQVDTLMGQVDIAPTVLGLLGLEYSAPFFGTDVLTCTSCPRIAYFNHNYDVAVYRDGKMSILGLGQSSKTVTYDRANDSYATVPDDPALTDLAVAIYQTGYEQFKEGKYK
jgi:phosphoglycerol transferase MdoB-like AlkP superfamily enzyme